MRGIFDTLCCRAVECLPFVSVYLQLSFQSHWAEQVNSGQKAHCGLQAKPKPHAVRETSASVGWTVEVYQEYLLHGKGWPKHIWSGIFAPIWLPGCLSAMPGGILNFCVGMVFEAYFPASVLSLQTIRMGKKSIALQVNEISPLSVDLTRAWTLSSLENVSANKQSTFNAFFFKSKKESHFLLVPRKPQLFFLNVCGSSKFSLAVFSEESCKPQDLSSKDILNLFWTTLRAHFLCPTCAWFGMLEDFVI